MPISRPYKLTHKDDDNIKRLVIAASPSQAIRHVSSGWKAEPASALEVATWMGEQGIPCEDATGGAPKEDPGIEDEAVEQQEEHVAATVGQSVDNGGVISMVAQNAPTPAPTPAPVPAQ